MVVEDDAIRIVKRCCCVHGLEEFVVKATSIGLRYERLVEIYLNLREKQQARGDESILHFLKQRERSSLIVQGCAL